MTEYSKYNLVYRLQKWMDSVPGQTFLNYAYSWGASIVILGTLFKLTHLAGANLMMFIGMGTEVCVFFLSAFDRPFDKTAEGRDIPTHVTEEYLETGKVNYADQQPVNADVQEAVPQSSPAMPFTGSQAGSSEGLHAEGMSQPIVPAASDNPQWMGAQHEIIPEMAEAQSSYVEELKKLTELLGKVGEQSERLTRDSEEMENLNRTLTGICKVYEMQLKGASRQIGTIDQINEQSLKMAQQIERLNSIYARMIEAMTVNMNMNGGGAKTE